MLDNNENSIFCSVDMPQDELGNNWMISFADLISLLLVFFILIYSMSVVKKPSWDKVKQSIVTQFSSAKKIDGAFTSDNFGATKFQMSRGIDMDYLYAVMNNKLKNYSGVSIENNGDKIIISLKKNDIFVNNNNLSSADNAQAILYVIGDGLQSVRNKIEVVEYYGKKSADERDMAMKRTILIANEFKKYGNLARLDAIVHYVADDAISGDKIMIIVHDTVR
jgi:chemotaxis protein MotB